MHLTNMKEYSDFCSVYLGVFVFFIFLLETGQSSEGAKDSVLSDDETWNNSTIVGLFFGLVALLLFVVIFIYLLVRCHSMQMQKRREKMLTHCLHEGDQHFQSNFAINRQSGFYDNKEQPQQFDISPTVNDVGVNDFQTTTHPVEAAFKSQASPRLVVDETEISLAPANTSLPNERRSFVYQMSGAVSSLFRSTLTATSRLRGVQNQPILFSPQETANISPSSETPAAPQHQPIYPSLSGFVQQNPTVRDDFLEPHREFACQQTRAAVGTSWNHFHYPAPGTAISTLCRSRSFQQCYDGPPQTENSISFDSNATTDDTPTVQASRFSVVLNDVVSRLRSLGTGQQKQQQHTDESFFGAGESVVTLEPQNNRVPRRGTFKPREPKRIGEGRGGMNVFGSTSSLTGSACPDEKMRQTSKKSRWRNRSALASSSSKDCSVVDAGHCNLNAIGDAEELDELDGVDNDHFLHSLESAVFVGSARYYSSPYQQDFSSATNSPVSIPTSDLTLGDIGSEESNFDTSALVSFFPTLAGVERPASQSTSTFTSKSIAMQPAGDLANLPWGFCPFLPPGSPVIGFAFQAQRGVGSREEVLSRNSDLQMRQLRSPVSFHGDMASVSTVAPFPSTSTSFPSPASGVSSSTSSSSTDVSLEATPTHRSPPPPPPELHHCSSVEESDCQKGVRLDQARKTSVPETMLALSSKPKCTDIRNRLSALPTASDDYSSTLQVGEREGLESTAIVEVSSSSSADSASGMLPHQVSVHKLSESNTDVSTPPDCQPEQRLLSEDDLIILPPSPDESGPPQVPQRDLQHRATAEDWTSVDFKLSSSPTSSSSDVT